MDLQNYIKGNIQSSEKKGEAKSQGIQKNKKTQSTERKVNLPNPYPIKATVLATSKQLLQNDQTSYASQKIVKQYVSEVELPIKGDRHKNRINNSIP